MKGLILCLFLAIPVCGCEQAAPPAKNGDEGTDYMFRVGTKWTYSRKNGEGKTGTFTARVTKRENGDTHLSYEGRDAAGSSEEVWWIESGGLCYATFHDGKSLGGQMLYKFGSKKGESWPNYQGDTTATHEGRVEVKVPAGSYKDAIHIKVTSDDFKGRVAGEYWLVPKVGWVKFTQGAFTIELEKFEQP